jgi:Regulated-SNARE-like domain
MAGPSTGGLKYAFISRGVTVLADATAPNVTGNFRAVAIQCLERCPPDNTKFTYTADKFTFNFLVDGGFTYLVVADDGYIPVLPRAVCCSSKQVSGIGFQRDVDLYVFQCLNIPVVWLVEYFVQSCVAVSGCPLLLVLKVLLHCCF